MNAGLTTEGVAALAPDAKVAAAGRKLGVPKSWESPGRSDDALWGECRGSAVYQVRVDLSDLAVKCSCPSRKHPCKHGIGLLFLHLETPLPTAPAPDWVTDWLARRAARTAAGKAPRSVRRPRPIPKAKEKRAQEAALARGRRPRLRSTCGWRTWCGTASRRRGRGRHRSGRRRRSAWWTPRRPASPPASGTSRGCRTPPPDWPEKLLDGLGRLALLSEAFRRLDALDEPLAESVRAEVGIPLSQEEVLERGEKVSDGWIVLGQRTEDEGRLKARRTWLLGEDTRRYAVILQFAAAGAPFTEGFVSGTVVGGELAFYPGAYPLRAVVRSRTGGATRAEKLPGHGTLEAFLDHTSRATASQPWLERLPVALEAVVPLTRRWSAGWSATAMARPFRSRAASTGPCSPSPAAIPSTSPQSGTGRRCSPSASSPAGRTA